ncbi:receptor-binding cancer antigen expressed on SiSo cells isoform 1-T1 [Trichechus inunguis]
MSGAGTERAERAHEEATGRARARALSARAARGSSEPSPGRRGGGGADGNQKCQVNRILQRRIEQGDKVLFATMAITQFRLFKVCTCLATVFSFLKRLICRSGRGRKLSGDQITLPTTVDYSSVPKQTDVEEWTSWDEDAPTSVKIEGGNGNVSTQQNALEQLEPDYFKDMTPTIRKTQKIVIKKREPLNFGIPDDSTGFSSRLAATQDMPFIHQSPELGDLDTWQENTNAWEEEEDAAWQAEEVLRQQKIADREKRAAEQQRKKMEKEAQRLMKKEQNKIGVKLS